MLAHDIPVLREIGGTVLTHYSDATSPHRFGEAIVTALSTPPDDVARTAGIAWADRLSWDAAARATAAALRAAAGSGAQRETRDG